MRIKLFTGLGEEITYLKGNVILKTPRKIIPTTFILDTGSPKTIIGYSDSMRLQIPLNSLSKEGIISIGGRKYDGYKFNRMQFIFKTEEGGSITEEKEVAVIKPTSPKEVVEVQSMPTIIGTDFLKEKRYKLFCDIAGKEAYLEK